MLRLGKFDLVLCFGLLYHLENPLLAVRHLRSLTEKCLLLESMGVPDNKPSMLLREEPSEFDQGLVHGSRPARLTPDSGHGCGHRGQAEERCKPRIIKSRLTTQI